MTEDVEAKSQLVQEGMLDPLESPWRASLLFGGVFVLVAGFVAVRTLFFASVGSGTADSERVGRGFTVVAIGLTIYALALGPLIALARRAMRGRSMQSKTFVTGGIVGLSYGGGCHILLGNDTGDAIVALLTAIGIWWAVTSGFNQAFKEIQQEFAEAHRRLEEERRTETEK